MVRLPRLVLPGISYPVTQRGNRRERTFFEDSDYALYRDLLAQSAERAGARDLKPRGSTRTLPSYRAGTEAPA